MARTGENIYKRKDGRWEGRYIRLYDADGKPKYGYVYARTYSSVKQMLAECKCNQVQNPAQNHMSITFEKTLASWLQSTRTSIKESTFAKYSQIIERHIRPALGQYPTDKISTQLIEGFLQQQLLAGRIDGNGGLSSKTVTDMLTVIKESLRYAQDTGSNISCNLHRLSIKKKEREMRVLTLEEQQSLVRVLLTETDLYKLGVMLALYTGIRIGELCALQWENLCVSSSILKVRRTLQRIQDRSVGATMKTKIIITEPKSPCSVRDIPLPTFLAEIAQRFEATPKAYVLTGDKNKYVEPRTMQNKFKKYLLEANISNVNFHATRHTFATRCIEVGFDVKTLSEILGHANVNITLNRYVHSSFELKRSNMNKLSLPL